MESSLSAAKCGGLCNQQSFGIHFQKDILYWFQFLFRTRVWVYIAILNSGEHRGSLTQTLLEHYSHIMEFHLPEGLEYLQSSDHIQTFEICCNHSCTSVLTDLVMFSSPLALQKLLMFSAKFGRKRSLQATLVCLCSNQKYNWSNSTPLSLLEASSSEKTGSMWLSLTVVWCYNFIHQNLNQKWIKFLVLPKSLKAFSVWKTNIYYCHPSICNTRFIFHFELLI